MSTVQLFPALYRSKVAHAFVRSAQQAGYRYLDYNAGELIGVSYLQATTLRGTRVTSGTAYLAPIATRKNLHILTKAWATKVLIDPGMRVGGLNQGQILNFDF